jgi:hypothetical protein
VRVPEQREHQPQWSDQWLAPEPTKSEAIAVPQPDELRIQRIKQTITARQNTWEADLFLAPTPVQEQKGERPYFPHMSLWVDRRSGFIMNADIAQPDTYRAAFQNQLLTLLEQARFLPKELFVKRQEVLALLEPIAARLGIKLKSARTLPALDAARTSALSYFQDF